MHRSLVFVSVVMCLFNSARQAAAEDRTSIAISGDNPQCIISSSGGLIAAVNSKLVQFCTTESPEVVGEIRLTDKDIQCFPVGFFQGDKLLVCWSVDHYLVLDVQKRVVLYRTRFAPPAYGASRKLCAFMSDEDTFAMFDNKDGVNVIDAWRGTLQTSLRPHLIDEKLPKSKPLAITAAGKASLKLIDDEGRTITWTLGASETLTGPSEPLPVVKQDPFFIDVSLDGDTFAYFGNGEASVWNIKTRKLLSRISDDKVLEVALSPTGTWLATGAMNGQVVLASLLGHRDLTLMEAKGRIADLSWCKDESKLLALTNEGKTHVFRVPAATHQETKSPSR